MNHSELKQFAKNWLNTLNCITQIVDKEKMVLCKNYKTYKKPDIIAVDIKKKIYAIECETLKGGFMHKIRYGLGHAIIDKIFFHYIYLAYPNKEYRNEIKGRKLFEEDFIKDRPVRS